MWSQGLSHRCRARLSSYYPDSVVSVPARQGGARRARVRAGDDPFRLRRRRARACAGAWLPPRASGRAVAARIPYLKLCVRRSAVSITGFSVETDTVLFVTLAFLAFILSFSFFRTLRTVRLLGTAVFWAMVAVVVFQCAVVLFGTSLIPFSVFADRSVNLLGKWNDLGILAALLGVFFLYIWSSAGSPFLRRPARLSGCSQSSLFSRHQFSSRMVVHSRVRDSGRPRGVSPSAPRTPRMCRPTLMQTLPGGVLCRGCPSGAGILSIAFLFFGTQINAGLTARLPVSSLECGLRTLPLMR